jgi:hypothetical protein
LFGSFPSSSSSLSQSSSSVASSSSALPSSSSTASSLSSSSNTRCKDSQNRELYCNWNTGCYAIDPAYAETPGQTCADLIEECQKWGTLFAGSLVEGEGVRCVTAYSSSSATTLSSSSSKQSSSSVTTYSSSSATTPIRLSQIAVGNNILQIHNGINLQVTRNAVIKIYNPNGKLIGKQNFAEGVYNVSLGYLPKGLYVVKATFGSEKKLLKVLVN